jgi:hypothetical protein
MPREEDKCRCGNPLYTGAAGDGKKIKQAEDDIVFLYPQSVDAIRLTSADGKDARLNPSALHLLKSGLFSIFSGAQQARLNGHLSLQFALKGNTIAWLTITADGEMRLYTKMQPTSAKPSRG